MKSKKQKALKVPNIILLFVKLLSCISTKLTIRFIAKLFITPIRYKMPKREMDMFNNCMQSQLLVPSLSKKIKVYEYGNSDKKILLVHGWSGRGTQLVKFSQELKANGCMTISFDAPAHGYSEGNTTIMTEFIACVFEINKKYGPFFAAIGHSLGAMSLLNAVKLNFEIKRLVVIGSGDNVNDIMSFFVAKLKLDSSYKEKLKHYLELKYNDKMDEYSASYVAKSISIPVLVIHDNDDDEVPVECSLNINKNLFNGKIYVTNDLGHRKILGDKKVVETVVEFVLS